MAREATFKKRLISRLIKLKVNYFVKEAVSILGISDIIAWKRGKFIALEVKKSKSAPRTKLQELFIDKVNADGGFGRFIYPENFEEVIREMLIYIEK